MTLDSDSLLFIWTEVRSRVSNISPLYIILFRLLAFHIIKSSFKILFNSIIKLKINSLHSCASIIIVYAFLISSVDGTWSNNIVPLDLINLITIGE
jgi:hypothetical protein